MPEAMLPSKSWATYEAGLRAIGEHRGDTTDDSKFLAELRLVADGKLTELGGQYFAARFVHRDESKAVALLQQAVLDYPPAAALCQILHGVAGANKEVAETVLRSQGFGDGLSERGLGALLMLMQRAGLVAYSKASGRVQVFMEPPETEDPLPRSIFIDPRTPFSNKAWLRRVLRECRGHLYWLDKHFMPIAFEAVAEAADANLLTSINILSLRLPEHDSHAARTAYRDLRIELRNKGIEIEWHVIPSTAMRDTHDRWIIGETSARNVPNVNAIYSGQHSEMNLSDQLPQLESLFSGYWMLSQPIFPDL